MEKKPTHSPAMQAALDGYRRELEAFESGRAKRQAEGLEALRRLLPVARRDTGQSRIVAHFLLGLYNGYRFKFDLTDFRGLDHELFEDCLAVLRMDFQPAQEVHTYFENGGAIWEQMAKDWNVTDYFKLEQAAKK